jgi:hypothetical protein
VITKKQVCNWFVNARIRVWQPALTAKGMAIEDYMDQRFSKRFCRDKDLTSHRKLVGGSCSDLETRQQSSFEHAEQANQAPEKDIKTSYTATTSPHQEPAGLPHLLLASPELVRRLGKSSCSESELLPLLLEHGIIRRVWVQEKVTGQTSEQRSPDVCAGSRGATADSKQGHQTIAKVASVAKVKLAKSDDDNCDDDCTVQSGCATSQQLVHLKGGFNISLEMLQAHFHLTIVDAARVFKVCMTGLKKVCRMYGIKRWPYRQVRVFLNHPSPTRNQPSRVNRVLSFLPDSKRPEYACARERRLQSVGSHRARQV